jgi:outer membrane receptor protein involved in Fe transport
VHPRLKLTTAVRYESQPNGDARLTPKIGVSTHLRAATTVKLLYSRALRSPSVYEQFYQSPPNYISNPALAPERIESVEAAIEHAFSPWAHISGSLFANRMEELIISKADEADHIQFVNALDANAHGFEVAWNSRSRTGVNVRASYSGLWDSTEPAGWLGCAQAAGEIQPGIATRTASRDDGTLHPSSGDALDAHWRGTPARGSDQLDRGASPREGCGDAGLALQPLQRPLQRAGIDG